MYRHMASRLEIHGDLINPWVGIVHRTGEYEASQHIGYTAINGTYLLVCPRPNGGLAKVQIGVGE